jgi:hypothetical protein
MVKNFYLDSFRCIPSLQISGSAAAIATKEEFELSPASKTRDLEHACHN